jgi:hypothetical protein
MPTPAAATVTTSQMVLLRKHERLSFPVIVTHIQPGRGQHAATPGDQLLPSRLRILRNTLKATRAKAPRFRQFGQQPNQRRFCDDGTLTPARPFVGLTGFETAPIRQGANWAARCLGAGSEITRSWGAVAHAGFMVTGRLRKFRRCAWLRWSTRFFPPQ